MKFNISGLLRKIPRVGAGLAKVYEWQPVYFNFALVGAFGVFLQYVITWTLITAGFPWWFAMFMGIAVAWNSNFIFNEKWVFKKID